MARRSNPALITTLCCFTALSSSLGFVCFFLPYVCPLDGDAAAGLTDHVWPPALLRADADTLMHNAINNCCSVHPSAGVVGAVPTLFVSTGAESHHHQPVNFNCSGTSARILRGTRTEYSSPPPAFAAAVVGKSRRRIVTALPNPDLVLVIKIIIVLADRAADQGKKKTGRVSRRLSQAAMALLIMLLLAAPAGSVAADAGGSRCSNDPNLPRRMRACGPPSIKPHN